MPEAPPSIGSAPSNRARELLDAAVVWDNHGCMPLRADASFLPQLERYRKAGVNVVSLNVGFGDMTWTEHLRVLSFMRQWLALRPDQYRLISTVDDIRRSKAEGKLGVVFDIEGMVPVQHDVSLVQTFYELGVRWMLIAYNRNNAAGGGCLDTDGGLTSTGRAVIDEMQRVGMVLCLSHSGARTAAEALEYSSAPVIFSHSNPHGDAPHARNVHDDLLLACARKGGVIGLSGIGLFLGTNTQVVERLLCQLRYVIDRVGAQHVGLGLDFVFDRTELDEYVRANPALFPPGLDTAAGMGMVEPESMEAIAEGLARDNLTDAQIRGVLGENWLRVATKVWH
ncbi:MAG TPA: membrane dipeptidase [Steroidobacteraceae bacterium]